MTKLSKDLDEGAREARNIASTQTKPARVVTVPFSELSGEWKKDTAFVAKYERIGPDMELAFALSEARREAGLTQVEVARRMGTSQAVVALVAAE